MTTELALQAVCHVCEQDLLHAMKLTTCHAQIMAACVSTLGPTFHSYVLTSCRSHHRVAEC